MTPPAWGEREETRPIAPRKAERVIDPSPHSISENSLIKKTIPGHALGDSQPHEMRKRVMAHLALTDSFSLTNKLINPHYEKFADTHHQR